MMKSSFRKQKAAVFFILAAIFLPTCVLSDRDSSPQEEYYLKNKKGGFKGGFKFLRNDIGSRKNTGGAVPVDIVPHNAYGEQDDYSIPKLLLFLPLVGAWMAALVLVQQVSPRATSVVSMICRHISEFTNRMSERTAAMNEKNRQQLSSMKRKNSSAKRRERNEGLAASDQSISPSLIEIANMGSDEFDSSTDFENSGGTSLFSSFRRAKTVVASNSKRQERNHLLREPSPTRGSPSKNKHATRMRRSVTERNKEHGSDRRYNNRDDERQHHRRGEEYHKHEKLHQANRTEERHAHSTHRSDHAKSKSSRMHEDLSPLEKKLSNNGSQRRTR